MNVIPAADFVLPDNSTVHRDELYFEGKLPAYPAFFDFRLPGGFGFNRLW